MKYFAWIICLLLFPSDLSLPLTDPNLPPVIGVFTIESAYPEYGATMIRSQYVTQIRSAGGRVVPVHTAGADESYWQYMFDNTNGLVLPGFDGSLVDSTYAHAARFFIQKSKEEKKRGGHYPILGICFGIQLLMYMEDNDVTLGSFDSKYYVAPLDVVDGVESRIFADFTKKEMVDYGTNNVTYHVHSHGISKLDFLNSNNLTSFYTLISTNEDRQGKVFVSTIEAKDYPIYGVQYHPELILESARPLAVWNQASVALSQHINRFVLSEAAKNTHTIIKANLEKLEINNISPTVVNTYEDDFLPYLVYFFRTENYGRMPFKQRGFQANNADQPFKKYPYTV